MPLPHTSPFVSGCSSSVRLGLATRVSLAGREAEVLQQQLLNRQWLPCLPLPPPPPAKQGRGASQPAGVTHTHRGDLCLYLSPTRSLAQGRGLGDREDSCRALERQAGSQPPRGMSWSASPPRPNLCRQDLRGGGVTGRENTGESP